VVLDSKQTALVAAGAVAAWAACFLLAMQLAYSYDLYWLLRRDFEALVLALAGLGITLLAVYWRSSAPHQDKVTIGVASLVSLCAISFIGGLFVACSNGNCL
jgi:uncharacterized membrane protein